MFRTSAVLCTALVLCALCRAGQFPALHAAVARGDLQAVKSLIASGADPNEKDAAGTPPIIAAVFSRNVSIVRFLAGHGSDVNVRQAETHATALFYAVQNQQGEITDALLASGADTKLRYAHQQTILHLAAFKGGGEILKSLLAAHTSVDAVDETGRTALDEAVLNGKQTAVALLLGAGADPNRRYGPNHRGPLDEAAIAGKQEIAKLLIAEGADAAALDDSNQSALDLALAYKNEKVVSVLLAFSASNPPMHRQCAATMERAVSRGRTAIARMLLDAGWNANERTASGSTYLNDAALRGNAPLSRLLLSRGARVEARNPEGGTPLHDAALGGDPEIVSMLLDRGAQIDAIDSESGATALMIAASLGHITVAEVLLRRGANPQLMDHAGRTALSRARAVHDASMIRLLENTAKSPQKS